MRGGKELWATRMAYKVFFRIVVKCRKLWMQKCVCVFKVVLNHPKKKKREEEDKISVNDHGRSYLEGLPCLQW
jgi:hypothetical protein